MADLKPCPFCGSTRAPEVSDVGECEECSGFDDCERRLENHTCEGCDRWERPMFVVCNYNISGCGASGPYRKTEAEAIAAWNSRAAMESDNWFYLPKPKEPIIEVAETTHAWDGTKVKTDVFYQVQEQAVINWAKELDEHIIKRICEVWNSRVDYHGYEQAAIEAWESIKAWNARATNGTLAAEQVKRIHEIIEKHWRDLPAEYDMPEATALPEYSYDWQAIADELNSRAERTCKMETDHDELEAIAYSHEDTWAYKCSACDWSFRYDRGIKPDYCPNCGRKCI